MVGAAEHDSSIDLPRFAEVMAHLRYFSAAPSDEVVARLGLAKATWEAATARWYAARDAELANGGTELTRRFGRLFAQALRDLTKRKSSLESLGPPAPMAPPEPEAPSWSPPPPPAPVSPPFPAPPAVVPREHRLAGTAAIGTDVPRRALPFVARGVAPPPIVRMNERPPPSKLGETVPVSRDALKQSTPFLKRPPPAARPDETVGLAPGAGGAPPLPAGVPDLTLPQYASLRVELQARPDAADGILARYGLRSDTRDALEAHWRARFEADPLLRMEFVRAYATYLGWLREQRTG